MLQDRYEVEGRISVLKWRNKLDRCGIGRSQYREVGRMGCHRRKPAGDESESGCRRLIC